MKTAPVIVGVDGSDASRVALAWAAEYADKFGLRLEALISWNLTPNYGYGAPQLNDELKSWAEQALAESVLAVLGEGAAVTQRVERGPTALVLTAAAESASLLVVGTRGRGAFAGMLLGSVSQHCAQHATCPVVIVPQPQSQS